MHSLLTAPPPRPWRTARAGPRAGRFTLVFAFCLAGAAALSPAPAAAHVSLEQPEAGADMAYKAVFRIGHGCEGSATHTVGVRLPPGFAGAKPMPKPGWSVEVRKAPLAEPYESHGQRVTEDVVEVTWRALTRDAWLADAHFDEFVLRGQTPRQPGDLWFKVQQLCEKGRWDWAEIPQPGAPRPKAPAVLLRVLPAAAAAHQH